MAQISEKHRAGLQGSQEGSQENTRSAFMTPNARTFFLEQEKQNQRLMAYAKFGVITAISLFDFLGFENIYELAYSLGENAGFLPVALAQLWLSRQKFYLPILKYIFLAMDIALSAYFLMVVAPYSPNIATGMENIEKLYFFKNQELHMLYLFLGWVLLTYSIRFVVWFGVCSIAAWFAQFFYVSQIPGSFNAGSVPAALQNLPEHELHQQLLFVNVDILGWNIQLIILLTVSLAFVIYSSRNLMMKFYKSQLQRNILSRYFSPSVVERLIDEGTESLPRQKTNAAVLFVDIVGFTPLCERISPDELLTMLQEFHSILEEIVFEHGGNMEKYIGDALMASFGVPQEHEDASLQAYNCARAMLDKVDEWNTGRLERDQEPIRIGIGVSYGQTITGTIGHGRNMAFVVLGQTVNMASRLQDLTRKHDSNLIVNEAFYGQIKHQLKDTDNGGMFETIPPVKVKGFSDPVDVRIWKAS